MSDLKIDDNNCLLVKFADDVLCMGHIKNNDERSYREQINKIVDYSKRNKLIINAKKTKEMIVDFRKSKPDTVLSVQMNGEDVQIVKSINYLGVAVSDDLKWTENIQKNYKKCRLRIDFLRRLKLFQISQKTLKLVYQSLIESILTYCIIVWFHSSKADEKKN